MGCRAPRPARRATEPQATPRPVMTGWRDAKGVEMTRERIAAVLDHPSGPCARCGATCHRYGAGGSPLCPQCRS